MRELCTICLRYWHSLCPSYCRVATGIRSGGEYVAWGWENKDVALRRVELEGNKFDAEDPAIETLREELGKRREAAGVEDEDDENWGVGDLDELESEDEDEEDDDEEAKAGSDEEDQGVAAQEKAARDIIADQQAEEEVVAQKNDKEVDDLADALAKTEIKK